VRASVPECFLGVLLIPWHPAQLRTTVVFFNALAREYAKQALWLIGDQAAMRAEIDGKLSVIDAIGTVAVGLVMLGGQIAAGKELSKTGWALAKPLMEDRAASAERALRTGRSWCGRPGPPIRSKPSSRR
jgi:hypothetical protein